MIDRRRKGARNERQARDYLKATGIRWPQGRHLRLSSRPPWQFGIPKREKPRWIGGQPDPSLTISGRERMSMTPASPRRLRRRLAEARRRLREIARRRYRSPSAKKTFLTLYRHKVRRLEELLGLRRPVLPPKAWYRLGEAARILSVAPKTLIRWRTRGKLRFAYTPGGHRRVTADELRRLLRERRG